MLKRLFIRTFGVDAYVEHVQSLTGLYHGLFRAGDMREAGIGLVPRMIPRGGVVFDIGAHIGKFAVLAARAVGRDGRVYAFEPVGWPRRVMERVVRLGRFRQVRVVPCGMSDHAGTATIRIPLKRGGLPLYMLSHLTDDAAEAGTRPETVSLRTIDEFAAEAGIERVDFIKCDVEGAEARVFAGGLATLARSKPVIFCEVQQEYAGRGGPDARSVFALLGGLGYRAYQADASGASLLPLDGYREPGDYFFIPPERQAAIRDLERR